MNYEIYAILLLTFAAAGLVLTAIEAYRTGYRRGIEQEQKKQRIERFFG